MPEPQRRTPVLAAALGLMWLLKWLTLQCYLRFVFSDLRDRSDIPAPETIDPAATHRRAVAVDAYVILWLVLEATALLLTIYRPTGATIAIAQGLAMSRIVDLLRAGLNTSLFDQVKGRDDNRVASAPRLVLLALLGYLELIACFGVIYASHLRLLAQADKSPSSTVDALYFSVLTQLTISFGNPLPQGWLRYVAASQGLFGLVLVTLIIARMMSSLRPLQTLDNGSPSPHTNQEPPL